MSNQNLLKAEQVLCPINDTAASPSIQFGGPTNADSGTGLYGDLNNIHIAIAGTTVLSINSTGIPALPYTPANNAVWDTPVPTTLQEAVDRIAAVVGATVPIPV